MHTADYLSTLHLVNRVKKGEKGSYPRAFKRIEGVNPMALLGSIHGKDKSWHTMNANHIISVICAYFSMSEDEFRSNLKNRQAPYPYIRQVCMYFIMENTNLTLSECGRLFTKDHATAIHSVKVINDYIDTNKRKRAEINWIKDKLING